MNKTHQKDEDCEANGTLDDNGNCGSCGATAGEGSCDCGGDRYHRPGCMVNGVEEKPYGPATEDAMEEWMGDNVNEAIEMGHECHGGEVVTFSEAGIKTQSKGLVVRFGATEFRITIHQSRTSPHVDRS